MTAPTILPPDVPTAAAIKDLLRARLGRQWRVGDRLPPVKELARQLGIGQSNTHLAVQELAKDGLLISRRRQGTFVSGLPAVRDAANPDQPLAGRSIVLYGSGPIEGFIWRMMDAFAAVIEPAGAVIRRAEMAGGGTGPFDSMADAIVLFNPSAFEPARCQPHQLLSIVTTTRYVSVANHTRYDVVGIDEHQGGLLAGRMLRESGCKRPCFVGRRLTSDETRFDATSTARLHGFEAGWGAPLPPDCLIKAMGYNPLSGGRAFGQYLAVQDRPDGIFTASDDIAVGLVAAAGSHGLMPGQDFQIVGFDGQDRGQHLGDTILSTVKVPCEQMGRRAARLLVQRFSEPDRPVDRLTLECISHRGTTTRAAH